MRRRWIQPTEPLAPVEVPPVVELVARALAIASGHRDTDAPYLRADGHRVAIWRQYVAKAEAALAAGAGEGPRRSLAGSCELAAACPGRRAMDETARP